MTAAVETLKLHKLYVIYPGEKDYQIDGVVEAIGIVNLERLTQLHARKLKPDTAP